MTSYLIKYIGPLAETVLLPHGHVIFKRDVATEVTQELYDILKNRNDFETVSRRKMKETQEKESEEGDVNG